MGFELPTDRIILAFEGDYEGLEIRCHKKVPARVWNKLRAFQLAEDNSDEQIDAAMTLFSEGIAESWNLEHEGVPVPLTSETLLELPLDLVAMLIPKWAEAVGGVDGPLENESPSGDTSPEESAQTEDE